MSASRRPSRNKIRIEPAPESAQGCGATGCSRSDDLLRVVKKGVEKILCQHHAREWLGR